MFTESESRCYLNLTQLLKFHSDDGNVTLYLPVILIRVLVRTKVKQL